MSNVISFNNTKTSKDIHPDIHASFTTTEKTPEIQPTTCVHTLAAVIGNVYLGERVTVAPGASIRGNEGQLIWVGNDVKVEDCVVIHALETYHHEELLHKAVVEVEGKFYGVYIDEGVYLAHQCQVQGPASIGSDTFIGMQALVFRATVGKNCIIEPKALVMGVEIGDDRYVPAGAIITTQAEADELPLINQNYPPKDLNRAVVDTNTQIAPGYKQQQIKSERKPA